MCQGNRAGTCEPKVLLRRVVAALVGEVDDKKEGNVLHYTSDEFEQGFNSFWPAVRRAA